MRQMSSAHPRSRLTSAELSGEHRRVARPRLQFEFSSAGRRRSMKSDVLVDVHAFASERASAGDDAPPDHDDAGTLSSFYIEVFLKAVSTALAAEGASSAVGDLGEGF